MAQRLRNSTVFWVCMLFGGAWLIISQASCGKTTNAGPTGLNVQYEVLNLSPDMNPVNLYIDLKSVNKFPFIYSVNQGYFYVPSTDTPYQIRTTAVSNATYVSRSDILKSGGKYSLFITGSLLGNSLRPIFTVDTATQAPIGKGKVRFVNASPSGTGGFDVYANGTKAFSNIVYPNYSGYVEFPVGTYDFQIMAKGGTAVLNDRPNITIQDGRLYTIYAYGYTSRADTAAFTSGIITNK